MLCYRVWSNGGRPPAHTGPIWTEAQIEAEDRHNTMNSRRRTTATTPEHSKARTEGGRPPQHQEPPNAAQLKEDDRYNTKNDRRRKTAAQTFETNAYRHYLTTVAYQLKATGWMFRVIKLVGG